ncbi:MAG: queuosine precursor transporter [Holosporaceae bacterium]|jgi:uncharacterized integral membrane protein (TIGR00697 family)|nr:queuosine precursor transporter [Holosporaceae bacterium]
MAELFSFFTLIICFLTILALLKFFGKSGLFAYSAIVIIISNIQVLKLAKYTYIENPIALGTVAFSTIFAIDNILTEYYGANVAKESVFLSFIGYLFFVIAMKIAVWHPTIESHECINLHRELESIFSPSSVLLISSLVSYIISQLTDIFVFSFLKKIAKTKFLSCRSLLSMMIATFVDNFVFSVLAWIVLADRPIGWKSLWATYILATYLIRLIVAALCVPLIKLAGAFIPREQNVPQF